MFWAPNSEDMAMCDTLMNLGDGVQPVFVMELTVSEEVPALTPKGVTFVVKSRNVEAALKESTTDTLVLSKI